jgi:serine/threonine protein kinase
MAAGGSSSSNAQPENLMKGLQLDKKSLSTSQEVGNGRMEIDMRNEKYESYRFEGDPNEVGHVVTTRCTTREDASDVSYETQRVVGNGSFGVVYKALCTTTNQTVAIKKVLQDKRFKNRELAIMKLLRHTNVVHMRHSFYHHQQRDNKQQQREENDNNNKDNNNRNNETNRNDPGEVYLNLVLDYVPDTVYRISKQHNQAGERIPILYVKLYAYQMARGLAAIHKIGVCHRDIKPQNLLVDTQTHALKICDFGSAKTLTPGEPNISYICSRYYRAPELMFGSTDYSTAIDVWSVGCVVAELLLGAPLFPGDSGIDQLVEIIKILGTPTREEILSMNPNYREFKFPHIKAMKWENVFGKEVEKEALEVIANVLVYTPTNRFDGLQFCAHEWFDELRQEGKSLGDNKPLPPLFDFTDEELKGVDESLRRKLIPEWVRRQNR